MEHAKYKISLVKKKKTPSFYRYVLVHMYGRTYTMHKKYGTFSGRTHRKSCTVVAFEE